MWRGHRGDGMVSRWTDEFAWAMDMQDTFDQAVEENQTEFDMDVEEAVRSAVEEFQAQGVDLSNILCVAPSHRLGKKTWLTWKEFKGTMMTQSEQEQQALADSLQKLREQIQSSTSKDEDILQLTYDNAMDVLLDYWKTRDLRPHLKVPFLELVAVLLAHKGNKEKFYEANGARSTLEFLKQELNSPTEFAKGMLVASAASSKHEKNKGLFMDGELTAMIVHGLQQHPCDDIVLQATCAAIKAITSADDENAVTSESFKFARDLANANVHVLLIECMRSMRGIDLKPRQMELLCHSLRQVCVNDEICKATVEEHGALAVVLPILQDDADKVDLVTACLKLLRQLAGSDQVKARLVQDNILDLLKELVRMHATHPLVPEFAIGLLAVLCLRNPETASVATTEDMAGIIVETMELHSENGRVQRSCCMAVRNMVVRNEEYRAMWLEAGIEPMLRQAKRKHGLLCEDVGSAALRDLGFDDYNST